MRKPLLLFRCLKGERDDEVAVALCVAGGSEVSETVMRLLAEVDVLEEESEAEAAAEAEADCGCE